MNISKLTDDLATTWHNLFPVCVFCSQSAMLAIFTVTFLEPVYYVNHFYGQYKNGGNKNSQCSILMHMLNDGYKNGDHITLAIRTVAVKIDNIVYWP